MSLPLPAYRIFPLGDSAITLSFGNCIDEAINQEIIARFTQLQEHPLAGMIEAVPAYSSLTIHYDVLAVKKKCTGDQMVVEYMQLQLEERLKQPAQYHYIKERLVKIPVCYDDEFAVDIQTMAVTKKITAEEIIHMHTSKIYKVYMLGFLPGFAYLGEVDERISMPRKPQPANIVAGSVGITGKQTGIYPLASPGGWQIIGRTPIKLFEATADEPTLIRAGDKVAFYSISKNEFESFGKSD